MTKPKQSLKLIIKKFNNINLSRCWQAKRMQFPARTFFLTLLLYSFPFLLAAQSISITNISATPVCAGNDVTITFSVNNGTGAGNYYDNSTNYQLYLSDETGNNFAVQGGSFNLASGSYTNVNNDVITGLVYNFTIPGGSISGSNYQIAIGSTSPDFDASAGAGASAGFEINALVTPSVSIAANPGNTICAGTSVTFTATPTDGGSNPSYQWKLNGSNVGSNSDSYTNAGLSQGDIITVEMISDAACATTATASSNQVVMTVNPLISPSVLISANPGNSICAGTSVTFTATPTNGGANPSYQWKLNGVNVGTNTNTYTNAGLAQGDKITVEMTSDAACASPAAATSNQITMTVNPVVIPAIEFYADPGNTVCEGSLVTFYATATDGGSSPIYQWKINGANVGTNSAQFSTTTLIDGDIVSLQLTSNAVCASSTVVDASDIVMTVDANQPVSVAISSSDADNIICAGTTVTFTATPTNGGSASYQWKLNGANVGANSNTYNNSSLTSGDNVSVVMTSDLGCTSNNPATSNSIATTVNPNLPVSVSVNASATTICAGTNVTFTATATNGGSSPAYQWKVNGSNVGSNSNTFSSSTLSNADIITVELTSNAVCATGNPAVSSPITMTVNPNLPVSVSIAASANPICTGTSVTFTATPTNGGSSPSYQWKVNGSNVGSNSSTYTSSTLTNGQTVTVVMTSNATCATGSPATSNGVVMAVNPILVPSVSIAASANPVCAGTNVTFTATPTNGGTTPSYQWKVNGTNTGFNSNTFSTNTLVNTDVVTVVMTSSEACTSVNPVTSNSVNMTVNPNLTASVSVSPSATTICAGTSVTFTATPTNGGGSPVYQWKVNGGNVGSNSNTFSSSTLNNNDVVTVELSSSAPCTSPVPAISSPITMTVNANQPASVSIAASPSGSICAGTSVTFTATPTNGGTPSYQWKVNGSNVGTNSNTYTTSSLTNGQIVTVVMTSNATCATGNPATSNTINMLVNPILNASVSIAASPASPICAGTNVTFTATPTNGGTPSYQWKLNGSNVGSNSATYSNSSLANGDQVQVVMTSTASPCLSGSPASSNTVTMTVNAQPTITLTSAVGSNIQSACQGSALPTSITYQLTGATGATVSGLPSGLSGSYNSGTGIYTISGTPTAAAGTYNYTVTTTGSCTNVQSTGTIKVYSGAPTIANGNGPSTKITGPNAVCPGPSTNNLVYNAPSSYGNVDVFEWSLPPGFVVTAGNNTSSITVSVLGPGSVVGNGQQVNLTMRNPCGTVVVSSYTVNVNSFNAVNAGPDFSLCAGSSTTLTNVISGAATRASWTAPSGIISGGPYPAAFTYTPSITSGTVTLTVRTDTAVGTCSPSSSFGVDQLVITVNQPVAINTQPVSQTICSGNSASFTVGATGTGLTYQWKKGATNLINGSNVSGATSATLNLSNISTSDAGTYNVVVSGTSPCTSVTSANATLTVNQVVAITTQPVTQTVCSGGNVNFTVAATGTGLSYQWKRNGSDLVNGGDIAGATSNSLTLSNVTSAVNGNYTVVVSGQSPCAAVTSTTAVLTVNDAVVITANPSASQTVCSGTNVSFSVTATGTGLTYQWRKNAVNLSNGANISGVTTATLNLSNVSTSESGTYTVVVSGTSPCTAATSTNAVLTVNQVVAITTQPTASTTLCSGSNLNLSVAATGTGLSYQWKKDGSDLSDGGNISGATTASLTVSNTSSAGSGIYTVVVTGQSPCAAITSNNATVTINDAVLITGQPTASQTVCSGAVVNLTVAATGTGLSYQWKKNGANLSNGGIVSGATTNTLTLTNVSTAESATYTVVISGQSPCSPVTSGNAVLTVNQAVAISSQPSPQTVCSGTSTSFSVTATGTGLSYQWKKDGSNISNGGNYSGATTNTLNINPISLSVAGDYSVEVTGQSPCSAVTSNVVALTVNEAIVINSESVANQTVCSGSNVALSVAATGTGISYQWKKNGTNISDGAKYSGTNTGDLVISNISAAEAGTYSLLMTGQSPCSNVTSSSAVIVVNQAVAITTQPAVTQTICSGNSVSFSVAATGSGLSYQWKKGGVDLTNAGNISGANSAILTISNATTADAASDYTVVVSGTSPCSPVTSNTAALIVNEAVVIQTQPASQTVCATAAGSNVSFTVAASGAGLTYQWRKNGVNISDNGNVTGTNTATLNLFVNNTTPAGTYSVVINGLTPCSQVTSADAVLTINLAPTITTQPANVAVCASFATSLSVAASGSNLSYQWYKGSIGSGVAVNNSANISGATSNILSFAQASLTDDGEYYVVVSGSAPCSPATSNVAVLNVDQAISITTQPVSQTLCTGANATFTVAANAGSDPVTFQWRKDGVNIPSAVGTTYTINNLSASDAGTYDVVVSGPVGYACSSALSNPAILNIYPTPNVAANPNVQTICSGEATAISLSGSVSGTTFSWTAAATGVSGSSNGSGSSIAQTLNTSAPTTGTVNYTITPTANGCIGSTTVVTITVNPVPVLTATPAALSICSGQSASIALSSDVAGAAINWTVVQSGVSGASNGSGSSISQALTATGNTPGTATYTITPSASGCVGAAQVITITVNPIPTVVATPDVTSLCSQSNVTVSLSGNVAGATYSWVVSSSNLNPLANGNTTTNSFLQTPVAPGPSNGSLSYTITPSANGCTGSPVSVGPITVFPLPQGSIIAGVSGTVTVCQNATQPLVTFTGSNGTAPYTFTYRINGGPSSTVTTSAGNSVTVSAPTGTVGSFVYNLVAVRDVNTVGCPQTANDNATVTVKILPTATISGTTSVCIGAASPSLTFTGANGTAPYTFTYTINSGANQTVTTSAGNSVTVAAPTGTAGTFTYSLVSVQESSGNSCVGPVAGQSAVVTVQQAQAISLLSGSSTPTVCINNALSPNTRYTISGSATGASVSGLPAGMSGSYSGGVYTISGTPTASGTFNYTVTTSGPGPCGSVTATGTITVDPAPTGGTATRTSNLILCAGGNAGTINLSGQDGQVLRWESSTNAGQTWATIANTTTSHVFSNLTQTTWFRAVVYKPGCSGVTANSVHAVVSVVPQNGPGSLSGISSPQFICSGNSTLTAVGFGADSTVGALTGGEFDNAGTILDGPGRWRKVVGGNVENIEASLNNTINSPFNLTNDKSFLASPCTPVYYNNNPLGGQSNNNKFMAVVGPNTSSLETPIFNLVGLSTASMTWWQAYILTAGASITIQISFDGGNTYNTTLATINGPTTFGSPTNFAQTSLNLDAYVGLSNLRIRFVWNGNQCSSWGLEKATITKGFVPANYTWALYDPIPAGGNPANHYLNVFTNPSVIVTPPSPNNTNSPITYSYSISSSAGGCAANINVTVNPVLITSPNNPNASPICSGSGMSAITFNSNVAGTQYSWTRTNTANVTGLANSQNNVSSIPAATLTNNTSSPQTVTFTITPANANACSPAPFTTSVTIDPNLSVVLSGNQSFCGTGSQVVTVKSNGPFPISFTLSNGQVITMNSINDTLKTISPAVTSTTTFTISSMSNTSCAASPFSGSATISVSAGAALPVGTWVGTLPCGGAGSDWFNPCNWGGGIIPTNDIDVVISSANAVCNPVIDPTTSYATAYGPVARTRNISISGSMNLSFQNAGQLNVAGNWTNNVGSSGFTANTGTVVFMGNATNTPGCASQTITTSGASENFYNLVINNTCAKDATGDNVVLNSPVNVGGTFTLTDGVLKTCYNAPCANILTITNCSAAAVVGGDETTYVNGAMNRCTMAGGGNYNFPVGNPNGPYAKYRPAQVIPTTASMYTAEYHPSGAPELDNPKLDPLGILNTEYWDIKPTNTCNNDVAVIGIPYINPNNDNDWSDIPPCSSCNVAIAKPAAQSANSWYFTDYPDYIGTGFDGSVPESRYYTNNGWIYSKPINCEGFQSPHFTFGFNYDVLLPVKLLSFDGKLVNEDARLSWTIADNKELQGFELEYSKDGQRFNKLATINPTNSNNYNYTDYRLQPGVHYYRLLIKDKNGGKTYSKTVLLVVGRNITIIKGLKATVVLGTGYVEIWSASAQKAKVQMYDMTGRLLAEQSGSLVQGNNSMPVNLLQLPQGVYNLLVRTDDGVQRNLRLMKE